MNCRKGIFCQPIQFYLDTLDSNKSTFEKKTNLKFYVLHFKKPWLVIQIYYKKSLKYSYKE